MQQNPCSWALDLSQTRTRVLVLVCLLAVAGCPGAGAEADEGGGLEASMRSSFLQFQEASEGSRTETQQNPAGPGSFLDTAAVVGRLFWMKLPQQVGGVNMADVVKVGGRHFLHRQVVMTLEVM